MSPKVYFLIGRTPKDGWLIISAMTEDYATAIGWYNTEMEKQERQYKEINIGQTIYG
jgi:hypothetical protein